MRPLWDPRDPITTLGRLRQKYALLLVAVLLGSIAATTSIATLSAREDSCMGGPSVTILLRPSIDGPRVTFDEAIAGARFPLLSPPGNLHVSDAWLSTDGTVVLLQLDVPIDGDIDGHQNATGTIYVKEMARPKSERAPYLDRLLKNSREAQEEEIAGTRAILQPTCSELEPPRRIGPRLRTGTLDFSGGSSLTTLKELAAAMLDRPASEHARSRLRAFRYHR